MNELVILKNEQAPTTSLKVAEVFEKRHDHILEKNRELESRIDDSRKYGCPQREL